MTKEEFLDYLYNNSDDLNYLMIIEFLFENYRTYSSENNNLVLPATTIARSFEIECSISHTFKDIKAGIFFYNNERKEIIINNNLPYDKQRYVIILLLFEFFKKYKNLLHGETFLIGAINLNGEIIIQILENEKTNNKIIEFPKKY